MDNTVFETLYEEYKKLVFNLALKYVLKQEEAEDITQEVFIKVYNKYHQYDPQGASLKTWICQIAINQSLDYLKAKKSQKRFGFITSIFRGESLEPIHLPVQIDHPGLAAEDKENLTELLRIIYALPENQKTAIILTKMEDRPQQEVAEIMGVSVKAVESLLQRAKQNIQKKLNENEGK